MHEARSSDQRGLTLIELVVFIVVVSVGLAGVMTVFNVVVKNSADPLVTKQALAVADAVMEEVLLKGFDDPDPGGPAETGRADWDNLDDFNACTPATPCDASLAGSVPGLANYQVVVSSAEPVDAAGNPVSVGGVNRPDTRQIKVSVLVGGVQTVELTGYRFLP